METLYSALEGEISTFVSHMQRCQEGFDLCSLYHVLVLVLPWSSLGQVESWQHLQSLAHCQSSSASPDMASNYVDWLASYLQHLSMLKERFDARVVVPLFENLYMHEEPAACPTRRSPLASIPHLAAQLFAHWRNWGLLLQGGTLSERVFGPQSLCYLHGFADVGPFVKFVRLVPDIFHQSLATADLAQRWVSLHHNRYSLSLPPSASLSPSLPLQPAARGRAGLAPSTVQPQPCGRAPQQPSSPLVPLQPFGTGSSAGVLRAQLQESQEELLALLQCRERAAALRTQLRHAAQHIRLLRLQQSSGGAVGARRREAALAGERQKSLELEEYQHSILEADWLLELEVRPILTRRIDAVQQHCQALERVLGGQALPAPQRTQLRNRMATTCVSGQAQPSASCPISGQ